MAHAPTTLATYDPTGGMWGVDAWTNFGKALAAIAANRRASQDRQEQRDLAQVRYLTEAAQKDPELANNPAFYKQMTDRYGKNFPEVGPILDTLRNRGQLLDTAKATHVRYLRAQGEMEQAHQALSSQLDATPETLPNGAPNIDKHIVMGQLQQLGDPAAFAQTALSRFTPEERSQIALTTKMFGDKLPTPLDPYKDFTPAGKELYAAQTGGIDPNSMVGQAAQYRAGLKLSPVKALEMAQATELQAAKQKAAMDEIQARYAAAHQGRVETDRLSRGRLALSDKLARGRMSYGEGLAEDKYDYTHPAADPGKVSYKEIVAGVKGAQASWDAQARASLDKVPQGVVAAKVKAAFIAQYGPRPADITPGDAMVLALRAEQAGAGDPTSAQAAISHMVSNYQAARAAGKASVDALATAQPGVPPIAAQPLPVPGMSAPPKPASASGSGFLDQVKHFFQPQPGFDPAALGGGGGLPVPPPPSATPPSAPPSPGPQAAPAPQMPGSSAPAAGHGFDPNLVASVAARLASHGETGARQSLDQHLGIRGPQADALIRAATLANVARHLSVEQQSIAAATDTEPETTEEDQSGTEEETP